MSLKRPGFHIVLLLAGCVTLTKFPRSTSDFSFLKGKECTYKIPELWLCELLILSPKFHQWAWEPIGESLSLSSNTVRVYFCKQRWIGEWDFFV